MRWMWIDKILRLDRGERLVAIKHVSLAEEHLHDVNDAIGAPIMPASLIIEGMAQSAGILVGATSDFTEKVILAKVAKATLDQDVKAGEIIRYDATIERIDAAGASTNGTVERGRHDKDGQLHWTTIGSISLLFSHLDQNMAGTTFPEHNFVFTDNFKMILEDVAASV